MWKIENKRILVFSDVHQRIDWVKAILDKEAGNFDHILSLGDWFDSFYDPPVVASVKETAIFVKELLDGKYGPATSLVGNHDVGYMEANYQLQKGYTIKHLHNLCSGYTNNKAQKINDILTNEDWKKMQLFTLANGFLCSHAGFRENNWRPFANVEENLIKLEEEAREALDLISFKPSHLFCAGFARGGPSPWGGPIWADWDQEFEDNLPLPQIVGHTPKPKTVKQIGKSYCIDGAQSTYAIINPDETIEFRGVHRAPMQEGEFYFFTPEIRNDDSWVEARRQSVNPNLMSNKPANFKY